MIVLRLALLLSLPATAAAVLLPEWADLLLLSGPVALASGCLLLRSPHRSGAKRGKTPVVIDGSNVLYWRDETPRIEPVREVIRALKARGFSPGVVFDANAGYLVKGRYKHDAAFGRMLGLPKDRVMVVPKGEPADATILLVARELKARVVSNDRFRDWANAYPEVVTAGHVIRGGYRGKTLWLEPDRPEQ
ncbi:MAG: hypothetical protein R3D84_00925 [Paracoccaceae bacterium]